MAITKDKLQQIAAIAQGDAQFFHNLAFKPEAAVGSLQFLTQEEKDSFSVLNPNTAMAAVIGAMGTTAFGCDPTCGNDSCGYTCGNRSCLDTCAKSCESTCGASCGHTSGVILST
ncbi:hypothetical protein G6O69_01860 [Pseudenhygromyxa sp. WMMC2535]|uniref:hypothetical protein n=1 Tax=Pseudenhygromyxa sp. WMMC2535 TaxID=2712867 RepID=UPI001554EEC7|nr:hypothetical protein [Pseudenhygromyxa sp. WMMC2535]NVB36560.1 hypothetical protein [Pseudenhygromyxa sp. WMMC2535]